MSVINIYDEGDRIKMLAQFTPSDPAVVQFELYNGTAYVATYQFGIDPEVTRTATGRYCLEIVIPSPGYWRYKVIGTGATQAVETWFFIARR